MQIADVLKHKAAHGAAQVFTVAPSDTVTALLSALAEHNVGALVVVDGDEVVGIASERDVVRCLAADGPGVLDRPVEQIMTSTVFSCAGTDAVDDIAETMTQRHIRHVPVLEDSRLLGVVSIGDIVSSRIRQLEDDRGQLEQYISG